MNALISPYINQFLVLEPLDLFPYTKSEKSNFFPFSAVDLTGELKRFCDQFSSFKPFMQVYTTAQTFIVGMMSPAGDGGDEVPSSFGVIERNSTDSEEEIKQILAEINECTTSLNGEAHSLEAQEEIRSKREELGKKLKELLAKTSDSISYAPELSGEEASSSFSEMPRTIESEQEFNQVLSKLDDSLQKVLRSEKEQLEEELEKLLATSSGDSEQKIKRIFCDLDNIILREKFNTLLITKLIVENYLAKAKKKLECRFLYEKVIDLKKKNLLQDISELQFEITMIESDLNTAEKRLSEINAEIENLLNSLEVVNQEQEASMQDVQIPHSGQQNISFIAQELQKVLDKVEFTAEELFQRVLVLMRLNIPYETCIETLLILLPKLDVHLTGELLLQILRKAILKKDPRFLDFFIDRYFNNRIRFLCKVFKLNQQ